jgi:hypothetical protein
MYGSARGELPPPLTLPPFVLLLQALDLLTPAYAGHPRVMAYVLRVLQWYPPEAVMFFMPQLVQALRYDHGGLIEGYLLAAAQQSNLFAHRLIWQLQVGPPQGATAILTSVHPELCSNGSFCRRQPPRDARTCPVSVQTVQVSQPLATSFEPLLRILSVHETFRLVEEDFRLN